MPDGYAFPNHLANCRAVGQFAVNVALYQAAFREICNRTGEVALRQKVFLNLLYLL
jgi:hypothetical protein